MEQFTGKSIFKGTAIGRILFYSKDWQLVERMEAGDVETEIARYETAKKKAVEELGILHDKAEAEAGEAAAMIFEAHIMMVEDEDFNDSVYSMIRSEGVNAEFAVLTTGDNFAALFSGMEDAYFKARAVDVKDVSERIITILQGRTGSGTMGEESVIIVAEDLTPSETVQMDKSKQLAFVTRLGSSNSHTAILARTMNIPALAGIDIREEWNGKMGIVDGKRGIFFVDPDVETLAKYVEEKKKEEEEEKLLLNLKNQPDETADGRHINLYANIGSVADVTKVLAVSAAGIGLFRSEFLYLEQDHYPTEEEQFQAYKTVAQTMEGKKVVIRTLDIGADKQAEYFNMEQEENPAMGYRAIRICLDRIDIFKTQLRALYRASAFGTISIMFPMIISVKEVQDIKKVIKEVKAELDTDGIGYGDVELGIMIETPAAVMISDLLAKEVDFFSIGTNDLTQYTLAVDRQNTKVDDIYDAHHPAILRMIQMVIDNGHKENCWVAICGELGADTTLTEQFIRMGIDELSVSPAFLLPVRRAIREAVYQEMTV